MVKKKDQIPEQTDLNDVEVFEEWEEGVAGDMPEEEDVLAQEEPAEGSEEELLDFPELDEGKDELPADELLSEEPLAEQELPDESSSVRVAEQPSAEPSPLAEGLADSLLELAPDIPVNLVAVIGKTTTNVGELMKYRVGQVVDLGRPPGETVDVVVNGRMIARGELVDMDGSLGVRILKMVR